MSPEWHRVNLSKNHKNRLNSGDLLNSVLLVQSMRVNFRDRSGDKQVALNYLQTPRLTDFILFLF